MSNVISFRPKPEPAAAPDAALIPIAPELLKPAVLRATARGAFARLACQLESAMQHARVIEAQICDPIKRQQFSDRIRVTLDLLDLAHRKIEQL